MSRGAAAAALRCRPAPPAAAALRTPIMRLDPPGGATHAVAADRRLSPRSRWWPAASSGGVRGTSAPSLQPPHERRSRRVSRRRRSASAERARRSAAATTGAASHRRRASAAADASRAAAQLRRPARRRGAAASDLAAAVPATPAGPAELDARGRTARLRLSFSADSLGRRARLLRQARVHRQRPGEQRQDGLPAWRRSGCTWASRAACSSRSTIARWRSARNSSSGDVARFEAGADGVLRRDPHGRAGATAPRRGRRPRRAAERSSLEQDHRALARRSRCVARAGPAWQHLERITREVFASLRLRGVPRPHHRADATVQALDRRLHRYRRERDVQLRRSGRGSHHAAARGDRRHRARDDLERLAAREPAEGVVHGPDVPARAAAGGALSAVSPNRRRGVRFRGARTSMPR